MIMVMAARVAVVVNGASVRNAESVAAVIGAATAAGAVETVR